MKIVYSLILLLVISCKSEDKKPVPAKLPPVTEKPVELPEIKVTRKSGILFEIEEKSLKKNEGHLLDKAISKFYEVTESQCFYDYIASQKMNETRGRTSRQVADHLTTIKETVPVRMYYARYGNKSLRCPLCSTAVAYRQPPSKRINLNRDFFDSTKSICRWAATISHESSHTLGYSHSMKWTRQREDTVPYILSGRKSKYGGDAFKKCCR